MAELVCDQDWMRQHALDIRATFAEMTVLSLARPELAVVKKVHALILANDLGFGQDMDCPCPTMFLDEPELAEAFRCGIQDGIDYSQEQTRWAHEQRAMEVWTDD